MKVAVGADHAGVGYKDTLAAELREAGHEIIDVGTHGTDSVDYPDFAFAVAERVARGDVERGIVICGSAVGVCIAANKVPGVRAGVCHDTYSAAQGVDHDDMNVLCMGERVIGIALARAITDAFLTADFSTDPRHRRRLEKVLDIEARHLKSDT
ncbi:MAG: ribose 5-phosphate isomerase B [Gemmatimonadota bacterium]|nr:ribose 5-phosphate isomerase B [Gemmatimonadota bacterium]